MARKRREEERTNHERWLVSYADFITLLFAFFVVMYAISSVNEGKYRVLSETLNHAFSEPTRSLEPIQVGDITRSGDTVIGDKNGVSITESPVPRITQSSGSGCAGKGVATTRTGAFRSGRSR